MTSLVRAFLAAEATVFGLAALIHFGLLVPGYEHREARMAESVIAAVLVVGLVVTLAAPGSIRRIGLTVQGFALVGTLVGLLTIAIGIGPRTVLDLTLHTLMIVLLLSGILTAVRRVAA